MTSSLKRPRWRGADLRQNLGLYLIMASALSFSVATVTSRAALNAAVPVGLIVWGRLGVGGSLLWMIVLAQRLDERLTSSQIIRLMVLGVLPAAQVFTLSRALERVSAPVAILLLFAYPAVVAVLSWLLRREAMTVRKVIALALSSAGIVLIVGIPAGNLSFTGCLFGLASALSLGLYTVLAYRITAGISGFHAMAWILTGAVVLYAPIAVGEGVFRIPSSDAWWWIILVGASAAVASALFLAGLQRLTPTLASISATVELILTALMAAVFLGDFVTLPQTAGGVLIISALVVVSIKEHGADREQDDRASGASIDDGVVQR